MTCHRRDVTPRQASVLTPRPAPDPNQTKPLTLFPRQVTITEPKKVRAVGLVDFPPRAVLQAVQAGVPVASLQLPLSLADRTHYAALELAKEYGIKVRAQL